MIDSLLALSDNINHMFKSGKEKNTKDDRPLNSYSEKLDYHLYEVLSDVSSYNGTGGTTKGMAITALITAAGLYDKCGIETEGFIKECHSVAKIVIEYNKTKDKNADKPIDSAASKNYKTV